MDGWHYTNNDKEGNCTKSNNCNFKTKYSFLAFLNKDGTSYTSWSAIATNDCFKGSGSFCKKIEKGQVIKKGNCAVLQMNNIFKD